MVDEPGKRKLHGTLFVERRGWWRTSRWWRRGRRLTGGARDRCRTRRGCVGVERRRGLAGLVHICLRQIYLLGQMLELVGDLVVVDDLGLVTLVRRLLVGVEAADDGLEQALQLVRGF